MADPDGADEPGFARWVSATEAEANQWSLSAANFFPADTPTLADPAEIARRRAAGQSWRAIARALKVPLSTVRRRMTACRKYPTEGELLTRHPVPTSSEGDQRVAT